MKTKPTLLSSLTLGTLGCLWMSCTGQPPKSLRLQQQVESFQVTEQFDTKIDLLWVVDNSASMDVSQQKLRDGFGSFAQRYLKPTWDIRVAVITTDLYMADSRLDTYRNTTISGSVGWTSTHVKNRIAAGGFSNPSYNPNLVNLSTGTFDSGIKYGEIMPIWGPNYARLLAGIHDGPITAFCFEALPYFYKSVTLCAKRDDRSQGTGNANCLNPIAASGQTSVNQCVNTVQNDTIHSGRPIISTKPPSGVAGDAAWIQALINDFMINVSTGSSGQGSERGMASLMQLLQDNEPSGSSFFRKGSLRGIIWVSDEEDQSMVLPSTPPPGFSPEKNYRCDQTGLIALNGASVITGINGFCCNDPALNCKYGAWGTSCPSKTIDGHTYTPSLCADPAQLISISQVRSNLDQFFRDLDQTTATSDPNYFTVSIVPLTGASIQALQSARTASDIAVGQLKTVAVDRGDRYLELGRAVGNGSLEMDLAQSDYTGILDAIGQTIISKKGTFVLKRIPTSEEEMLVSIRHSDGTTLNLPKTSFEYSGSTLKITDIDLLLSLNETDVVVIDYQPTRSF